MSETSFNSPRETRLSSPIAEGSVFTSSPRSSHHFIFARSDDEIMESSQTGSSILLALPDVVKSMKEYDGLGTIPLFPQFASDMIRPNALRLDPGMDITPWIALKKKIQGVAGQDFIATAMYKFCILLRSKYLFALSLAPAGERTGASDAEMTALMSLWDTETLEALARLWEMSYNKSSLVVVATFFDRPNGPCPPASELKDMSKKALGAYLASLGMPFMAPFYANGLVEELAERRDSLPRVSSNPDAPSPPFTADLASYQTAFVRAVLMPSDSDFEAAFARSFAAPALSSSSSSAPRSSNEPAAPASRSHLDAFRAALVPAPAPKKQRSEPVASSSPSKASYLQRSFNIAGSALSDSRPTFNVSPLSGSIWPEARSSVFPTVANGGASLSSFGESLAPSSGSPDALNPLREASSPNEGLLPQVERCDLVSFPPHGCFLLRPRASRALPRLIALSPSS